MQTRKTAAALALPALLLAGCSLADVQAAVLPAENTATIETAPTAAPQSLTVYASASLTPAARAYADAQGVALTETDDAGAAAPEQSPEDTPSHVDSDGRRPDRD